MSIFGDEVARAMADRQVVSSPAALHEACESAAKADCDEFILVPASADRALIERTVEALSTERWL
jgi:hypothetical protein